MTHIELAGKRYHPLQNGPMAHDIWLMNQVAAAGLSELAMGEGETAEAYVERLLHHLLASGKVFALLAGLLLPEGVAAADWQPATADGIAAELSRVTDPADKAAIRQLVVGLLLEFFPRGLASSKTSPSYLNPPAQSD